MFDPMTSISLAIAAIGAMVWIVRVEGRVNSHDALFIEREKQSNTQHNDLKERLVRIEQKLDHANGSAAH